uniref:Putative amino acid permease/transporter n=1 Tax=Trypanosoma vivax (strain Y486) TaxID=1055687 RepID=G0UBM2_TRYVY|nr:putative amino acid permease/transporter [Trypanosoma vivax Y486]
MVPFHYAGDIAVGLPLYNWLFAFLSPHRFQGMRQGCPGTAATQRQYFEHPRSHLIRRRDGGNSEPVDAPSMEEGQVTGAQVAGDVDKVVHKKHLSALMLMALMYTYTISGAYAIEETVLGGGPLLGIISIFIIPIFMSAPTAIIVSEMATALPSNAAFLMWYSIAFHSVVYFVMVILSLLLIFVDNALYSVLISEYICSATTCSETTNKLLRAGMLLLTYTLNIIGIEAVGNVSIVLSFVTLFPFLLLFAVHLVKGGFYLNWPAISYIPSTIDWATFITTSSWNLCGLEQAATVVEEVKTPRKTFLRALVPLLALAYLTYIPPILTGSSVRRGPPDLSEWTTGFWSHVAWIVGGLPMQMIMVCASALSAMGLMLSTLCTTTHVIAGVAYTEVFPGPINRILYRRNKRFGTYHWTLTINALITGLFGVFFDFGPLVKVDQVLYALRVIMIFISFLVIRHRYPHLERPFKVPLEGKQLYMIGIPIVLFVGLLIVAMTHDVQTVIVNFSVLGAAIVISLVYCLLIKKEGFYGRVVTETIDESMDELDAGSVKTN